MPDGRKSHGRVNGVQAPLLKRLGLYAARSLRRWQMGRTTDALQSLSDDMLHDIGIARADIPAIALSVTAPERSPDCASRLGAQSTPEMELTL